jgi:hypothetical protein
MKKILIMIIFVFCNVALAEEKIEELEQFEIRKYTPQKSGVTDLVFEARIDHLTETLTKNLVIGKLVDVSFKIYWLSPSQYRIDIQGLPNGFEEVRANLISLIKGNLEFVLPEKFSEKLQGYTLKKESVADGKLIHATDATYTMAIPVIDILFDKSGQIKTIETKAAMSAVKSEFFQTPKAWSNNKFVLDKVIQTTRQGATLFTTTNSLEYLSVNGIGFPSKLTIKNISEVTIPATKKEKEKKVKSETNSIIRFTKYEVNSGSAQRYIMEGIKR